MTRATIGIALLLTGLAAATRASAQQSTATTAVNKARLFVSGLYWPSAIDFGQTRTFTEFAEEGTITARHSVASGFGFEGGIQYAFARRFATALSFAAANRDSEVSYDATLPHPLYPASLGRQRRVSATASGPSYKEQAVHLTALVIGASGKLEYMVGAGPSLIRVEAALAQQVQYSHQYPYDTVTVTGLQRSTVDDSPLGFNVLGALDYRLGTNFGFGAQARFSRASAKLDLSPGPAVKIDGGGLDVGLGLRLYF